MNGAVSVALLSRPISFWMAFDRSLSVYGIGESTVSLVSPSATRFFRSREQQAFGQDVRVGLLVRAGRGDHHLAMFLEVHQPVGHGEVVDVEQLARALERGRIFTVRIDHDDMTFRRQIADAMHDQSRGGRLAGTGRAEQREMLAQHRVDVERAAHVLGRVNGADLDTGAVVGREHLLQILAGDREDAVAGDRISSDTALEVDQPAGLLMLVALAEEVDVRDDIFAAVGPQVADVGEQPAPADLELDLAADLPGHGDARIGIGGEIAQPLPVDPDLRSAPGDFGDEAELLVTNGARQRRGRNRRHGNELDRFDLVVAFKAVQVYEIGQGVFPWLRAGSACDC
jgi:hypothetical protein